VGGAAAVAVVAVGVALPADPAELLEAAGDPQMATSTSLKRFNLALEKDIFELVFSGFSV